MFIVEPASNEGKPQTVGKKERTVVTQILKCQPMTMVPEF